MYPLAIFVLGWIVELLLHLASGSPASTLAFLLRSAAVYGGAVVVGLSVYRAPPGRLLVDRGKLLIPLLGPVERDLGINRFFHVFNLLYCTGGLRVEQMLRVATRAVTNVALKQDLLRAVPVIERGGTIARALAEPEAIAQDYKTLVLVGEESGTLEEAFGRVATLSAEAVDTRLNIFTQLVHRLFMPVMVFSIAVTAGSLFLTLFSSR
jgi:type II secretory pathway component PulF